MARTPDGKLKNHDIRVRIDSDLNEELVEYCTRNGTDRAKVIRLAIEYFLDRENQEDTDEL